MRRRAGEVQRLGGRRKEQEQGNGPDKWAGAIISMHPSHDAHLQMTPYTSSLFTAHNPRGNILNAYLSSLFYYQNTPANSSGLGGKFIERRRVINDHTLLALLYYSRLSQPSVAESSWEFCGCSNDIF